MTYVKKIDAMRAIAVTMVIIAHWIPKISAVIPLGGIGVDIFFVISGFLITRNLLSEKIMADSGKTKLTDVVKNFVARRALRIFPIYYLSLCIFFALEDYESYHLRENFIYYVTYTSNILFFLKNSWDGYLSPLWSLAVEEQFYLVWPLLIIFINPKYTTRIIIASILIGMIFPYFFKRDMVNVLTPACLNSLGMGALLAWLTMHRPDLLELNKRAIAIGVFFLLLIFAGLLIWSDFNQWTGEIRSIISILSVVWIMYSLDFYKSVRWMDWIMNNRAFIFIGQISYGLYLYHNIVSVVFKNFIFEYFISVTEGTKPMFANALWLLIKASALILLSWMSYEAIERPILKLKRYFS